MYIYIYIYVYIVDNYYLFLDSWGMVMSQTTTPREWNKGAGMTHTAVGLSQTGLPGYPLVMSK